MLAKPLSAVNTKLNHIKHSLIIIIFCFSIIVKENKTQLHFINLAAHV